MLQRQVSNNSRTNNTDQDSKLPPIRVRQESLHLINTKAVSNPLIHFNLLSNRTLQRDLLVIGEKEFMMYDPNNEQLHDYDSKLRRIQKNILSIASSQNGQYLCLFMIEGDLMLYKVKDKRLLNIKGVQKVDAKSIENPPKLYINDSASIIIISHKNQDCLWMWTMSKENQNLNILVDDKPMLLQSAPDIPKKPSIFRSSSFDKRVSTFSDNQSDQIQIQDQKPKIQGSTSNTGGDPYLRGTWLSIQTKDVSGPFSMSNQSFAEGFDLRFINQLYNHNIQSSTGFSQCDSVKIAQIKMFTKSDYFKKSSSVNRTAEVIQVQQQQDENIIIEMSSQNLTVNFTNKGGSHFESSSNSNNIKSRISSVEYTGQPLQKQKAVITRLDNQCQLVFTVLNSQHMLYCQVMFSNFDTSFATTIKLFDFVSPDDCPTFDSRGKTNLCIDDVMWTNNDAFVLIIFNSCSFAVLPRLGSSLIQIFNPTILNISQKMVEQFTHYKNPKKFNELILPMQLQQKNPQVKSVLSLNKKTITLHPFEDSFIISDGQMCFIFRIEFEPELTDLFSKTNMSYYFLRFCISLDRLAIDPDILEKIPQLLTNKLPLFEFEKNAELDEEEDPGQVIMTASQINPYDNNAKRMETNQSFNAEFTLDCQTVLLNLKHLLMGLRWNKNSPINYYQWLITVVNDCFFYFLKNSEPIYAFHALRIAEAYCKKNLFLTESDQDMDIFEVRNQEFHSKRDSDFTNFDTLKKFFDAVHDMYDYHNTHEYMSKSTAEKLLIKYDMFERLPTKLSRGSGNWRFQFTKNYTLLVYYSLIQFRNYQAANFNILFLVFACYILQRYLDSMFSHHLQRIIEIVYRNFQLQKKSDDYELFLGKSGKNYIIGPAEKMKQYQDWVNLVLKFSLEHISQLYEQENMENIMDTCSNELISNHDKVEKNIGYLGETGSLLKWLQNVNQVYIINENASDIPTLEIKQMISRLNEQENQFSVNARLINFNISASLHILMELHKRNYLMNQNQSINIINLYEALHRIVIDCTSITDNDVQLHDQFHIILNNNFQRSTKDISDVCLIPQFQDMKEAHQRQVMAVVYFYLNDISSGVNILDSQNPIDNSLFKILVLSTAIKQSLRQLEVINIQNKELENSLLNSTSQIRLIQQKANCVQTVKKSIKFLKCQFQELYTNQKIRENGRGITDSLWASLLMLPNNTSPILREELSHQSLKKLNKILKYLKINSPLLKQNNTFRNQQDDEDLDSDKSLFNQTFSKLFGPKASQILQSFINNDKIMQLFRNLFEQCLISIVNQENGFSLVNLIDDELVYEVDKEISNQDNEKLKQISSLITSDFKKFTKICVYLKNLISMLNYESQILNQTQKLILCQQAKINNKTQLEYFRCLIILSQFDKYQNSQLLISKAFILIKPLMKAENQMFLSLQLNGIQYSTLNRSNKQKISQILDIAKQQKDTLGELVQNLENFIFSEKDGLPLEITIKDYYPDLISQINNELKIYQQMSRGENICKRMKMILFERSIQAREIFGISFDYSLFYEKATFERRFGNIFGLNDSTLDKFKGLIQKQESKRKQQQQEKYDGQQLSFRGREQSGVHSSADTYRPIIVLESPGRVLNQGESPAQSSEILHNLMKRRQLGMPQTPQKDKNKITITGTMVKMIQEGQKPINHSRKVSKMIEKSPTLRQGRQDKSIDFDNREHGTANVMKITKRRDSIKRQFVILNNPPQQKQEGEEEGQQRQNPLQKKAQHRKGQMSMVPTGPQINFNLRNQKILDQNATNNNAEKPPEKKQGPPPGLPKAGIPSSRRAKIQNAKKNSQREDRDTKLQKLVQNVQRYLLRSAISIWSNKELSPGKHYESPRTKNPQNIDNQEFQKKVGPFQSAQKLKSGKGGFNLMLVKKDGDNYTVQDAKHVLKNANKNQSISIPASQVLQPPTLMAQKSEVTKIDNIQNQQPTQQLTKQIINAKPFQFIRVQSTQLAQGKQKTENENMKSEGVEQKQTTAKIQIIKHQEPQQINTQVKPKQIINLQQLQQQQQAKNKSKKNQSSKEQYLNFIQKYKQISEKIDKVQKDANQLNSDFQKLN